MNMRYEHHHGNLESTIVEQTTGSIAIKNLMIDAFNKHDVAFNKGETNIPANVYYAKVVVANLIDHGLIMAQHMNDHGMPKSLIAEISKTIRNNKMLYSSYNLEFTLNELKYNDHFLFELMNELMNEEHTNVFQAAARVELILKNTPEGRKTLGLPTSAYLQAKLAELGSSENKADDNLRHISIMETGYALSDNLRLTAADVLIRGGYSISRAFDEICQADGDDLRTMVSDSFRQAAVPMPPAAPIEAKSNPTPQEVIGSPELIGSNDAMNHLNHNVADIDHNQAEQLGFATTYVNYLPLAVIVTIIIGGVIVLRNNIKSGLSYVGTMFAYGNKEHADNDLENQRRNAGLQGKPLLNPPTKHIFRTM
jgi:hypothetical protein